jgi:hypothetical protein
VRTEEEKGLVVGLVEDEMDQALSTRFLGDDDV